MGRIQAQQTSRRTGVKTTSIKHWLDQVAAKVKKTAPQLMPAFLVHRHEAEFARAWLADDIKKLNQYRGKVRLLEIGAGSFLLACQLQREGFAVIALEPVAPAYANLAPLQKIVLELARAGGFQPTVKQCTIEHYKPTNTCDMAYSVNVMFQLRLRPALKNIMAALKPDGYYHFLCTNYAFPYEPDFHIPNLGSKKLTGWVFRKKIFAPHALHYKKEVTDPYHYWHSLNWITPMKIKRIMRAMGHQRISFRRDFIITALKRVFHDPEFSARHGLIVVSIIKLLFATRLIYLFSALPAACQPVIDCVIMNNRTLPAPD